MLRGLFRTAYRDISTSGKGDYHIGYDLLSEIFGGCTAKFGARIALIYQKLYAGSDAYGCDEMINPDKTLMQDEECGRENT